MAKSQKSYGNCFARCTYTYTPSVRADPTPSGSRADPNKNKMRSGLDLRGSIYHKTFDTGT
jgi:hypothetical protein